MMKLFLGKELTETTSFSLRSSLDDLLWLRNDSCDHFSQLFCWSHLFLFAMMIYFSFCATSAFFCSFLLTRSLLTRNSSLWQLACSDYASWAERISLFLGCLCFRRARLRSLHRPEPSCPWTNGSVTAQVTHLSLCLLISCYTKCDIQYFFTTHSLNR